MMNLNSDNIDTAMSVFALLHKLDVIKYHYWEYEYEDDVEAGCRCGSCCTSISIGIDVFINDDIYNYEL